MKLGNLIMAAAMGIVLAAPSHAGGLSPEIMEAPAIAEPSAPAAASLSPTIIIVGVLAALLLVAATQDDETGDTDDVKRQ